MEYARDIAMFVTTPLSFEDAVKQAIDLLKEEGFGVLTDIDVQATLNQKLGVQFKGYRILGACHPPSAYRVLSAEPQVGVLLPCNVAVWDEGDHRVVSAMNPNLIGEMIGHPVASEVAAEIGAKLHRVLTRIESVRTAK